MTTLEIFAHFCVLQDAGKLHISCPGPVDEAPIYCTALALMSKSLRPDTTPSELETAALAGLARIQSGQTSHAVLRITLRKVMMDIEEFGNAASGNWN